MLTILRTLFKILRTVVNPRTIRGTARAARAAVILAEDLWIHGRSAHYVQSAEAKALAVAQSADRAVEPEQVRHGGEATAT